MFLPSPVSLASLLFAVAAVSDAINPQLVGTWTSKSGKVLTGPEFYKPAEEKIIEPKLTGISYSFSQDGFYEEALYRAIPNPVDPKCPSAMVQWQHGTFTQGSDSSLKLTPIAVDGRQLFSDPCNMKTATLTRYNQTETFTKAEVLTDPYNNKLRLNLFAWDGTPVNPMWIAASTPLMLPTKTLTSDKKPQKTHGVTTKRDGSSKAKRDHMLDAEPVEYEITNPLPGMKTTWGDRWFWIGISMTTVGGFLVLCC